MKPSEERKENERNSLRLWLDHLGARFSGRGLYVLLGSLILVTAGILIYRYWSISRANLYSSLVLDFNFANTDKDLEDIIKSDKHAGKGPASWARLQEARLSLYPDGIAKLGSFVPEERTKAIASVEKSRKRYEEVAANDKDAALKQEAYTSLATGEQCLLGTPKAENTAELRGAFDKMIDYYRKAAAIEPDSPASKRYAAKADELKAKRDEVEKFYRRLAELSTPAPKFKSGTTQFSP